MSWVSGSAIVAALGGRWSGNKGIAHCPMHPDRTASLSVTEIDGYKVLLHCFAGCDNTDIIAALRDRGLWNGNTSTAAPPSLFPLRNHAAAEPNPKAVALWNEAVPVEKTLAACYLATRKIRPPFPRTLRYHPHCWHPQAMNSFPALIARIDDRGGRLIAVQRTYLEGTAKIAAAAPRLILGTINGGAVRFGPAAPKIGIAEGIETALSAAWLYRMPVWTTLGAGRLSTVWLPVATRAVVLFCDADDSGIAAALKAKARFHSEGRRCELVMPRLGCKDFNEMVQA